MSLSKRVLTITEFIDAYGIGRTKLYELIKNNEIVVKKFGRKTLIPIDEAERWLESLPNA